MIIKNFTRDLDILLLVIKKLNNNVIDNNLLNYVRFSPFISNKIGGRKQLQEVLEKIYKNKIGEEHSHLDIPNNFDIDFFIKINKVLPYYNLDKIYWLNMMFFSELNIISYLKNGINKLFLKYMYYIHINYLEFEDIVISGDNMYKAVIFLIKKDILLTDNKNYNIEYIKDNNLILMLLSDYKDILYKIREKKYVVNIKKINARLSKIEELTGINRDKLMNLDFFYLMKNNMIICRNNINKYKKDILSNCIIVNSIKYT